MGWFGHFSWPICSCILARLLITPVICFCQAPSVSAAGSPCSSSLHALCVMSSMMMLRCLSSSLYPSYSMLCCADSEFGAIGNACSIMLTLASTSYPVLVSSLAAARTCSRILASYFSTLGVISVASYAITSSRMSPCWRWLWSAEFCIRVNLCI